MAYTFPAAARKYERSDRGVLPLAVTAGALPPDLAGFVYLVAPAGREVEESDRAGAIPFLNGDGTVYRIELGAAPELRWALTKPPCLWAERGLPPSDTTDWGITRLFDDLRLGGRNLLNTAFQAVRFGADSERVLVTYEAGRPFEIDPVSLEVLTPVGRRDAWLPTMMGGTPFELVAGTSHPAFDPDRDATGKPGSGTLFALNFVRDADLYIERVLRFLGLDDEYEALGGLARGLFERAAAVDTLAAAAASAPAPGGLLDVWPEVVSATWKAWKRFRARTVLADADAKLLFWDGAREPGSVRLLDADGDPLELRESAHQMGVTEHWVVCMDAAFKFEMDAVLPDLDFLPKQALALVRRRLSRVQPQTTKVHLVPRAQLVDGKEAKVVTIELPAACVHFFVDYADAGGTKITLTAIDNAATDSAEFLLDSDSPAFLGTPDLPAVVRGMIPCGVDVDRIVRFELDVPARKAVEKARVADLGTMWTLGLMTGPAQFTAAAPGPVGDLYVFTHGLIPAAVSRLIWELYWGPEYPRRVVPIAKVAALAAAGGIAPRLLRYDAATPTVIADSYAVPPGWLVLSPTCVPGGTRGYVVTTAFSDTAKEIWIFDGASLSTGPICKLAAAPGKTLPWGYTLHTTYLADARPRPAGGYRVRVEDDLVGVATVPTVVKTWVLPNAYRDALAPPDGPAAREAARAGGPVAVGAGAAAAPAVPVARAGAGALGPAELLERLRNAYDDARGHHPRPGVHTLDDAIARFELDVLLALEPDRPHLAAHLEEALTSPEHAPARDAVWAAHARGLERIFDALRALDPLALPPAFPEPDLRRAFEHLGRRSLRLWASERAAADVRSIVVGGIQTLTALVRADPRAPERSALSRAVDVHALAASGVLDRAAQRRVALTLIHTLLGPGL